MFWKLALTALCVAMTVSVGANQRGSVPDRDLPSVLLDVAREGTVLEVARELVFHGVPSAVIVRKEEGLAWPRWARERERLQRDTGQAGTGLSTASAVVEATLASKTYYTTHALDQLVFFVPLRASPCLARLLRPGLSGHFAGPVFEVAHAAIAMANDARPPRAPGMVFIGPNSGPPSGEPNFGEHVEIRLQSPSLAEVLSEMAIRVPGLGWGVLEHGDVATAARPQNMCRVFMFTRSSTINLQNLLPMAAGEP